ncbi:MAG: formylglycine-generating enzyme family protein [Isosphaerales bacterium]
MPRLALLPFIVALGCASNALAQAPVSFDARRLFACTEVKPPQQADVGRKVVVVSIPISANFSAEESSVASLRYELRIPKSMTVIDFLPKTQTAADALAQNERRLEDTQTEVRVEYGGGLKTEFNAFGAKFSVGGGGERQSREFTQVKTDIQNVLVNSIGMKLKRIPAGTFLMGALPEERNAKEDERPQHRVRITRPFYLGVYEVTQHEYKQVMGGNPSLYHDSDQQPVDQVSWPDAVKFCNKLSEREGRKPYCRIEGDQVTVAGGNGYRLPTEAEWEYACRAGSSTRYPFADDENQLGAYAWSDENAGVKSHPVGLKRPNAWGLYDTLGNVGEWCADGYDEKYYESSPPADPPGASGASHRIHRGGSKMHYSGACRPASRGSSTPETRISYIGFRVAAVQE